MQKVLMLLFIIMDIVFIVGYFINSGILFFSNYFILIFCLITFVVGLRYYFSKNNIEEQNMMYRFLAITLIIVSLMSFLFIIYISLFQPFFYLKFK